MEAELDAFVRSTTLLVVLLNPFLMSIYLIDLIESLDDKTFFSTLVRGVVIATTVFCLFAVGGDAIFSELFQVRFASFLIFGGIVFIVIGLRFIQVGPEALSELRGHPEHIAGSIAMPFMIGPGTVSASVLAGARLPVWWALAAIGAAMLVMVVGLLAIKWIHGFVKERNAGLVERYVDIIGRASALLIGTIAVDMVLTGFELWWNAWRAA
ncbi:MAG TPA: MarC family protein [Polyangiales bacterium]|jgi:multiple antibiotic resistance protein|nr:MarC family protein [Polyangiales bacterium]